MSLNLAAVMDAIAAAATTAMPSQTRIHAWPVGTAVPPALVVAYPEDDIDLTAAGDGTCEATFPVYVVVGRPEEKASRDLLDLYVSGSGARAVEAALDGNLGGAVQSCAVQSVRIVMFTLGAVDHLAARFAVDVIA